MSMPKCWKHGDDFNGCTWSSQTLYMSMYNDIELSGGHHYLDFLIWNKKWIFVFTEFEVMLMNSKEISNYRISYN